jgi:RNA polymerase sigma-70 factor (ECF subfamily)
MAKQQGQQATAPCSEQDRHGLVPLLERSLEGDSVAFNTLIGKLRPWVRIRVYQRLGPELVDGDGSDLVQDAFTRICGHFEQFHGSGVPELLGWVRTITDHVVADYKRRRQLVFCPGSALLKNLQAKKPMPEQLGELAERAIAALEQLPHKYGQIIQLRIFGGLAFAHVGNQMGMSEGAARVLFIRAIQRLRQKMEAAT